ncbi:MAG TPA: 50S ribosomal protein L25/general stress protein Ctc [Burkholderiales bacterium]|nr:50S ribosomal protein L25/general stress protein Ctc [Burkholderiales bacterium]
MEVNATSRSTQGRGASRRLRHAQKVPGIVYGAGQDPQPIELDHKELGMHLKAEAFHASILTLNLDGQKQQVLLRDYQMHPWRQDVLHVDFQRVAQDRKIHMKVPLHFINAEMAPGVKTGGGTVNHVLAELDVACLPADLPNYIEVDLANLQVGHSIHLSELTLPKGVEAVRLRGGDDPVVVTISVPRVEAAAEEAPAATTAAPIAPAPAPEKKEEKK